MFCSLHEGREAEEEAQCKAGVSQVPAGDRGRDGQKEQGGYRPRQTVLLLRAPGELRWATAAVLTAALVPLVWAARVGFVWRYREVWQRRAVPSAVGDRAPVAARTLVKWVVETSISILEQQPKLHRGKSFKLPLRNSVWLWPFNYVILFPWRGGNSSVRSGRAPSLEGKEDSQPAILFHFGPGASALRRSVTPATGPAPRRSCASPSCLRTS